MVSGSNKTTPEITADPPAIVKDPVMSLLDRYLTKFFHELLARDVGERNSVRILIIHHLFFRETILMDGKIVSRSTPYMTQGL